MRHSCGLAQMEPSLLVQVEAVEAGKEEVASNQSVEAGGLGIVEGLADAKSFLQQ